MGKACRDIEWKGPLKNNKNNEGNEKWIKMFLDMAKFIKLWKRT